MNNSYSPIEYTQFCKNGGCGNGKSGMDTIQKNALPVNIDGMQQVYGHQCCEKYPTGSMFPFGPTSKEANEHVPVPYAWKP